MQQTRLIRPREEIVIRFEALTRNGPALSADRVAKVQAQFPAHKLERFGNRRITYRIHFDHEAIVTFKNVFDKLQIKRVNCNHLN